METFFSSTGKASWTEHCASTMGLRTTSLHSQYSALIIREGGREGGGTTELKRRVLFESSIFEVSPRFSNTSLDT